MLFMFRCVLPRIQNIIILYLIHLTILQQRLHLFNLYHMLSQSFRLEISYNQGFEPKI